MTDERMGDRLWDALARLPRGAGVVFRHYRHPQRRALYDRVRRFTRQRGVTLVLAGTPEMAIGWRADGVHGATGHKNPGRGLMLRTASAHDAREIRKAELGGADLIFLSPVFATRSHLGDRPLGPLRFGLLARGRKGIVALGGMNIRRARRLQALGAYGWAAIDAWTGISPAH